MYEESVICSVRVNLTACALWFFHSPPRPNSFWLSSSLLSNGPIGKAPGTWSWLLTSIPVYRIDGVLPPLHDVVFIKHKNKFTSAMKVRNNVVPVHDMTACGGLDVYLHSFLTSALDGGNWSISRSKWAGHKCGLDVLGKRNIFCLCRDSSLGSSSS
jgi:hypothetical protein